MDPLERYTVDSVSKALQVLDTFRQSEELSLAEITERVGLNKSRVFRLLHTLAEYGYIERNDTGTRYALGVKLLERAACVRRDLRQLALPYMRQLHELFNETINLGVLDKEQILYVEMLESSRPIRMAEAVGSRSALHSTALGKAILAHLPDEECSELLVPARFYKYTEHTITNLKMMKDELELVWQRGYAFDDRENDTEGFCIGAPFFNASGRPVAAISVSGPYDRVQAASDDICKELLRICGEISIRLGCRNVSLVKTAGKHLQRAV